MHLLDKPIIPGHLKDEAVATIKHIHGGLVRGARYGLFIDNIGTIYLNPGHIEGGRILEINGLLVSLPNNRWQITGELRPLIFTVEE